MKAGAVDYIAKPFNVEELGLHRRPRARREAAPRRERLPEAGARRPLHVREHHRQGLPDAGDLPHDRADRKGLLDGAHHRRERHGQGADRPGDPLHVHPERSEVRLDQLRRAAGDAARVRALRPRAGRLHGRDQGKARPLLRGRRRHPLPGRDLRDDADDAGQAAPRDPGEAHPEGRRQRGDRASTCASSPRPTRT